MKSEKTVDPLITADYRNHKGVIPFTQKIQKVKFQTIINNLPPLPPTTIGERIKEERLKLGWTGYELGDYIGVNNATIYHWENGATIYKLKHRRLVSYFLGM